MKRFSFSSFLVLAIMASGVFWMACTPPPPPGPTAEELAAMRERARQDSISAVQEAERIRVEAEERRLAEEETRRQREAEEARRAAEAEARRMAMLSTVYFDYDKSNLRDDQRTTLDENARRLREYRPEENVLVEGHADERGTVEYNLALGERRASAVKKYLSDAGVEEGRISTISYGEERPADPGHTEGAWSRNRRTDLKRQ
ncbi:MAG: peptidoglycan-associated lipoprotein Pal [Candidatus Latescibacteria bacterium]|jgi:peptidoglycan-associated lipoprotein|nr:peptidoglycan-associated lipoprotein Pal [Candidatus Latescibacterota bacterium]